MRNVWSKKGNHKYKKNISSAFKTLVNCYPCTLKQDLEDKYFKTLRDIKTMYFFETHIYCITCVLTTFCRWFRVFKYHNEINIFAPENVNVFSHFTHKKGKKIIKFCFI